MYRYTDFKIPVKYVDNETITGNQEKIELWPNPSQIQKMYTFKLLYIVSAEMHGLLNIGSENYVDSMCSLIWLTFVKNKQLFDYVTSSGPIPKHIEICGVKYKIIHTDEFYLVDNEESYGYISSCKATIHVTAKLRPLSIVKVLLHEVMHGILFNVSTELSYNEAFVETNATIILNMVSKNKDIFKNIF